MTTSAAELTPRLVTLRPTLVVLEATGGFEMLPAITLAKVGLPIAVVNPRQVRDCAKAMGRLAKTDALDAGILAAFAQRVRPEPRPLPDEAAQLLDSLLTRRRQLVDMLTARRIASASPAVRSSATSTGTFAGSRSAWPTSMATCRTPLQRAHCTKPRRTCYAVSQGSDRSPHLP